MNNPKRDRYIHIISFIFAISAIIDYITTIWFAGTKENLIQNEFSPLLIYTVRYDLLGPYVFLAVIFRFFASIIVLIPLSKDEKLFYPARTIILLISTAHILGGFSWYINNDIYSNTITFLLVIIIMMTIFLSGWLIFTKIISGKRDI